VGPGQSHVRCQQVFGRRGTRSKDRIAKAALFQRRRTFHAGLPAQFGDLRERLHNREIIEQRLCAFDPIVRSEEYVAVEPGDLAATEGDVPPGDIEQPFFLPEHRAPLDPDEDVGIVGAELEPPVKRQLHADERRRQSPAKFVVIRKAAPIPARVEIAGDCPQTCPECAIDHGADPILGSSRLADS